MQSITALAHLNCAIVFILDVSGTSEYSIAQQVSLFKNIRPLFANKPLVLVANKVDIQTLDALDDEDRALIASVTEDGKIPLIPMSNVAGDGINDVKTQACDLLLEHRISAKLRTNKVDSIRHRINVARPVARDNKERPVHIPASVLAARAAGAASEAMPVEKRRLMREIEAESGGAGVFNFDMRMHWDLDDATWTQDGIPEIWNGRNVADFFDADIEARLNALEAEEAIRCDDEDGSGSESDLDPEQKALAQAIDKKKRMLKIKARDVRTMNQPQLPRTKQPAKSIDEFAQHLETMGLPSDKVRERTRGRKRARHPPADAMDVEEDMVDDEAAPASVKIARVRSRSRARSMTPGKESAFKDEKYVCVRCTTLSLSLTGRCCCSHTERRRAPAGWPRSTSGRPTGWRGPARPTAPFATPNQSGCSPASAASARPTVVRTCTTNDDASQQNTRPAASESDPGVYTATAGMTMTTLRMGTPPSPDGRQTMTRTCLVSGVPGAMHRTATSVCRLTPGTMAGTTNAGLAIV